MPHHYSGAEATEEHLSPFSSVLLSHRHISLAEPAAGCPYIHVYVLVSIHIFHSVLMVKVKVNVYLYSASS